MIARRAGFVLLVGLLLAASRGLPAQSEELTIYKKIREEGSSRSQVVAYAAELIDGIGPRLTGSPNLRKATEWARKTLLDVGCANVRVESWGVFGLGWQERNVWVRMREPDSVPLIARTAPWSPGTRGPVSGQVVAVRGFTHEEEFEPYQGKLRGKIVLLGTAPAPPEIFPIENPLFERWSDQQLADFAAQPFERPRGYQDGATAARRFELMEKTGRFFAAERAAAVIVPSGNNPKGGASGGTIHVDTNYTFGWHVYQRAHAMRVPLVVMAIEHYGRLSRLLSRGRSVRVDLNVDTETSPGNQEGFNVLAEIPGTHPEQKSEFVMLAAHLDSWTAGTGATDDGAGVIIAIEAMRILKAVQAAPHRTIRLALWTGEEQGSLGSRAYAQRHLATVPLAAGQAQDHVPEFMRPLAGPIQPRLEHARISAVYTLDAGGGRIRGVSTGNPGSVELFRQWFAPLRDLGVAMVAPRSDCGGDCWTFEQIGIPTPSFLQDPLDYHSRTHHTNMDTSEHLVPEDLRQAAIVVATTVYNTAMHNRLLPRLRLDQ